MQGGSGSLLQGEVFSSNVIEHHRNQTPHISPLLRLPIPVLIIIPLSDFHEKVSEHFPNITELTSWIQFTTRKGKDLRERKIEKANTGQGSTAEGPGFSPPTSPSASSPKELQHKPSNPVNSPLCPAVLPKPWKGPVYLKKSVGKAPGLHWHPQKSCWEPEHRAAPQRGEGEAIFNHPAAH